MNCKKGCLLIGDYKAGDFRIGVTVIRMGVTIGVLSTWVFIVAGWVNMRFCKLVENKTLG